MVQYTDKQKAAYYAKKAGGAAIKRMAEPRAAGSKYSLQKGPWAKRGAALGSYYGARFGPVGAAVGGFVGRRAFHYPAKIFGSGAYRVSKRGGTMAPQVPSFGNVGDYVTISHREYLGDIHTGNANEFNAQTFSINPGDVNTFPWLSNLCQTSYQQYKFEGLSFEYKSFSGDSLNSTNTALGSVFSAISYDWNDPDPTTRNEIENTDWSSSAKPSENFMVPVEVKSSQSGLNGGLLYVLNGNNIPNKVDPKTYYLGKITIGTQGFQAADVNIGSLYVTYKIRLYKPIMTKPLSNAQSTAIVRTGCTNASMFGVAEDTSPDTHDSIGVGFSNGGTVMQMQTANMQVGSTYLIMCQWFGASTVDVRAPQFKVSTGLDIVENTFNGLNVGDAQIPGGNANNGSQCITMLRVRRNADYNGATVWIEEDNAVTKKLADEPNYLTLRIWQVTGVHDDTIGTI